MAHWFEDPINRTRVRKHIKWFYENENSVGHDIKPPVAPRPVSADQLTTADKTLIKDIEYLLGYLVLGWGTRLDGTRFQRFIDGLHHPTIFSSATTALGIRRRAARRPVLTDRAKLAQQCLDHPGLNLDCYSAFTGGTARRGIASAAAGQKSWVASSEADDTGHYVDIDTRVLKFLIFLGNRAHAAGRRVCVTCVVNGDHSSDSGHYLGIDVDIDKSGYTGGIYAAANEAGLTVLDEDDAHYHVHPPGRP